MEESTTAHENPTGLTAGAILASAVLAALVAFFLRRAMRAEKEEATLTKLVDEITDGDLRDRAAAATGEFLRSHLGPELRPMMLSVLRDVREYVDKGFQRAEQSIRDI